MSFADPLALNYGGVTKNLPRINQDNYGSVYSAEDADGSKRYTVTVKHTIPPRGEKGESHMIRLDVEHRDGSGIFTHTATSWIVVKSFDSEQVTADADAAHRAVSNFLSATSWANLPAFLARES